MKLILSHALVAIILFLPSSHVRSQVVGCEEILNYNWGEDPYDYVTYEGRHRTLFLPRGCDSLFSLIRIQDFLDYGDLVYELAEDFFGWEFIHPMSLETRLNPSLRGGGTGFGGTGYEMSFLGVDPNGFDPAAKDSHLDNLNTVVHEGIHRWDFRGQNYYQGVDIAHPFNAAIEDLLYMKTGGRSIGQHVNISPHIYGDLSFKKNYKWYWRKYLTNPNITWDSYFGQQYTFEELEKLPRPDNTLRIFIQGAPFMSAYVMHGEEGIKSLLAEIERRRLEDPNWNMYEVAQPDVAIDQYVRIFGDGLRLNVAPYFDYWKIPLTNEQRAYLAQYPASEKILDSDGDGFSPLQGDFDDTDPEMYPDAPETIDGKDNNQDGQVDEVVLSENSRGDLAGSGKGELLTLPLLVQGTMADLEDEDVFHIVLDEKTLINVVYTSMNGRDTCTAADGKQYTMFNGILELNGGYFRESELYTGQNNNHWNGYLGAGEYIFKISPNWENACPGDYEIQIYVSEEVPQVVRVNDLEFETKIFNGLDPDPNLDFANLRGASAAEGLALKQIYDELGGADWWDARGWMASSEVCYWKGVSCGRKGIGTLEFNGERRLVGALTEEMLAPLSNLGELRILEADFQGDTLADAFGPMRDLRMIGVNYNNVGGPLPSSLGNKPRLWYLDLHANQFSGSIPESWSHLPNLKQLQIQQNQLNGPLPSDFYQLKSLQKFHFDTDRHCVPNQRVWDWLGEVEDVNNRDYLPCHDAPTPFEMLSPINATIDLARLSDSAIAIDWSDSMDPEGDTVDYTWYLCSANPNFDLSLTFAAGNRSDFEIQASALSDSLKDAGILKEANLMHFASASDGDFMTFTDTVNIILQLGDLTLTDDLLSAYIHIFPNPAQDLLTVQVNSADVRVEQIEIFDMLSRPVGRSYGEQIEVAEISSGIYMANIHLSNGSQLVRRVVVE